jgi:hypothetical protein
MQHARHRHAVALPLFLAGILGVFSLSLLGGTQTILENRQAVLAADATQRRVVIDERTVALVQPGGSFVLSTGEERPRVTQGEVIVETEHVVSVIAGETVATVIGGAFSILRTDTDTIIASLSVPVLVEDGQAVTIVPHGYQYRSGQGLLRVPEPWVQERAALLSHRDSQLLDRVTPLSSDTLSTLLSDLHLSSGRTDLLPLLALAVLTAAQPMQDDVRTELVTAIQKYEPALSSLPFILPQIARFAGAPLPEHMFAEWSNAVVRLATTDVSNALDALSLGADAARLAHHRGYPIQSTLWEQAVRTASPVLASIVHDPDERDRILKTTEDTRATHASLTASLDQIPTQTVDVTASASNVDPVRLLAETSVMLLRRGVLQTGNTEVLLDAAHPGMSRVRRIYREEDGVLVEYAFSYDPSTDTVAHIVRGSGAGEALPNAVSGEVFFR